MEYDVLVIGAGSAGIAFSKSAASFGKSVLLVESSDVGGTCVNRGCVPKKYMWLSAYCLEIIKNSRGFGIDNASCSFNWQKMLEQRNAYIERIHGYYKSSIDAANISYIDGAASLLGNNKVEVAGKIYKAEKIILATGMKPRSLDIIGYDYVIDSDDFFNLSYQPKEIVIYGAGYIAVEIACLLQTLGTRVTLVCRKEYPLTSFDTDIRKRLALAMRKHNINIINNSEILEIKKTDGNLVCVLQDHTEIVTEHVLSAVGRDPALSAIDNTNVQVNDKGYIDVDDKYQTNEKNIYALGDIIGTPALTPVAIAQARKLANMLYGDSSVDYAFDHIPTIVFSHPVIATIGLSEDEARARFGDSIKVYTQEFVAMAMLGFDSDSRDKSFYKMVCDVSGKIIGLHLLGVNSDEILQGFATAIHMGATKQDFDRTIALHPTSAEELVTMR